MTVVVVVVEQAASDSVEAIVELAFQTINKIVTELYVTNMAAMIDSFQVRPPATGLDRLLVSHDFDRSLRAGLRQVPVRVCVQPAVPGHQHGGHPADPPLRTPRPRPAAAVPGTWNETRLPL